MREQNKGIDCHWLVTTILAIAIFTPGCVTHQAPTIAHVHLGHTITGATDTPNNVGYLVCAEQDAESALTKANAAVSAAPALDSMKSDIKSVNEETNSGGAYPLIKAVQEMAHHIKFASESSDASSNLKEGYLHIQEIIAGVTYRGDLINLYAQDASTNQSATDVQQLAVEIQKLAYANVHGEDTDGDGKIGTTDREYGVMQIRREIDALIARENPPYSTVDRWYLFNLIRLPTGEWMFRRSGGDKSKGY
jgi:hypothetical protein